MAENYVQIRIKASDTAKPELDSLRADLDELGSKVDTARVDVDDEDAKRKLLEINAELAALNKRVANPKIDTAGAARAESRIEKLKGDVNDLVDKTDQQSSRGGLLNRLLFGAGGGGGGGGAAAGEAGEGSAGIAGAIPDFVAVLAAVVPAAEAAIAEVAGLVSGFAAAGAGAGAFALLAAPAVKKVETALTNTTAAQQAYQKAQLAEKQDPTTAHAKAAATALRNLHNVLRGLSPDERSAVREIQQIEHTLGRMSRAFEPTAFKVFNDGLKIAKELLPDVTPFAKTFGDTLDGLLKQVGKFAGSKGFHDWLNQFHKLEGPSIHAIGEGIGKVGTAIGKLLSTMSAKDVVHTINIAFDVLAGTIRALAWAVRGAMRSWDQLSSAFRRTRHDIASAAHDIAHVFDVMRHDIAAAMDWVVHRIEQNTDHVRTDLVHWAQDVGQATGRVVSFFRSLPGRVMSALASLPGRLFSFGAHIIEMLASGIRSAIGDVTGAIGSVAGEVLAHIPMSPAKKGPLSGRGDPRLGGMRIGQMLAQGLGESAGAVDAAANRLVGGARFGGHGGGAGGGELRVALEVHGSGAGLDAVFMTWLKNAVRKSGGDPRMFERKVAFR